MTTTAAARVQINPAGFVDGHWALALRGTVIETSETHARVRWDLDTDARGDFGPEWIEHDKLEAVTR